ncbi:MAG: DUF4416 family protein [Candidatus Aminicenantes bacterium]
MAEATPFMPVKLICGILAVRDIVFERSMEYLKDRFGPIDHTSPIMDFKFTDYYERQMGEGLNRKFVSFVEHVRPESLSDVKIQTNALEEEMKKMFRSVKRIVNLDPGYMTASALIMATAKDFSHRIPLQKGIYAHLELLFGKNEVKALPWTYPDYRTVEYHRFFLEVRKVYLTQLKSQDK